MSDFDLLAQITPTKRAGLSLEFAFKPRSAQEWENIANKIKCISCGADTFITGDSGPERHSNSIVYYRHAAICTCHFTNFYYVIVNDVVSGVRQNVVGTNDCLEKEKQSNTLPDWRVQELIVRAAAAGHQENYALSERLVKICLSLDNKNQGSWYNLGWLYCNRNQFDSAIYAYRRVIGLGDGFPSAYLNLGCIFENLHCFEDATEMFDKFLALYPEHNDAKKRRENCRNKVGRYFE